MQTKRLILLLTCLAISFVTWSQIRITGKVTSADDISALPGIVVQEKGTGNGTATDVDGTFTINVSEPNAILVFSFIGMVTQEVPLKGQRHLYVTAKWDCNKDFFDSQTVSIQANSGLVNTPIGARIELASPWFWRGVVKSAYSYQTNLKENEFHRAKVEFAHSISTCDYDVDFRWELNRVLFDYDLNAMTNSGEAQLNTGTLGMIAGLSHLNFRRLEPNADEKQFGTVIGVAANLNWPTYPSVSAKVGVFRDKEEYQVDIQGYYMPIHYSIRFYKLDAFTELSLSVGLSMGYKMKRQKG